jgi:hypothetical protein
MHPPEVKQAALDLIATGHNDCEVARQLGIPRATIRDWRRPTYVSRRDYADCACPRCWRASKPMRFEPEDYTELLGLYLGDGHIAEGARTDRLRLSLDARYDQMNAEIEALMRRCFPHNRVGRVQAARSGYSGRSAACLVLSVYSAHLRCLFPQHGPGRKHERPIRLEPWQETLVEQAPWGFVRGCIRSDGCAFINRTDVHREKPYEYLSYGFSNKSEDIARLFVAACDLVGVRWRLNSGRRGVWAVRINRRQSVAMMVDHVGLKA